MSYSRKSIMPLRALCEGAILLALAMVLNSFKLFRLPNGGSISLEMLPIFVFALRWGVGPGLLTGFLYGLMQMFVDGAVAWGWQSMLLDYLVAFTPLGLAGLFRGRSWGVFAGSLLAAFVRFLVHYISGITIYAILAPQELFNVTFTSPWMYSLVYNGSYMLVSTVVVLIMLAVMLASPLKKFLLAADLNGIRND